jgi:hypothetical protein
MTLTETHYIANLHMHAYVDTQLYKFIGLLVHAECNIKADEWKNLRIRLLIFSLALVLFFHRCLTVNNI